MKITRIEYEKIIQELERRTHTIDYNFYNKLYNDVQDNAFVFNLRSDNILELYDLTLFKLIEVDIIKIVDNKLIVNL